MFGSKKRIPPPEKKIAIVGLPNTGKTELFNRLTGTYSLVANYPQTTVEEKRGVCVIYGETYQLIDTPGLHCLCMHSEEELAVRRMLFNECPDVVVQCIDATCLTQSLALTADLLELELPLVVSLNAIDEMSRKGMWVDSDALCHALGVQVVETMATSGLGIGDLKDAISTARPGKLPFRYSDTIQTGLDNLKSMLDGNIPCHEKISTLLLQKDPFIEQEITDALGEERVAELREEVDRIRRKFGGDLAQNMLERRSYWIDEIVPASTKQQKVRYAGFYNAFSRFSRHPLYGLPIVALFMMMTYLLVVHVAGFLAGLMDWILVAPTVTYIDRVVQMPFLRDFLIGDYGILTLGLLNALCTVLPILSMFFLMMGLMEDIGYIPNLCILTKRLFDKIGLTGKATMSLVLAFGCKTMATLTTKGLRSFKERYIAIYLIAFAIPCSAQMALHMAVLGKFGLSAFFIAFGALFVIELGVGALLNKIIKSDLKTGFIMEMSPMRAPNPKAIVVKTYYRLVWFLKEAVPVFLIAALLMFLADKTTILYRTKMLMKPLVMDWLQMPIDMVDALILCLARHEAAAGKLLNMVGAGELNYIQSIVAVVLTTMFVPCFANIVAMCKELGVKVGLSMAVIINVTSFILAGILSWTLIFFIGR